VLGQQLLSKRVCLSVCLSRWCIVSKRLNLSSNFLHCLVATAKVFWGTKLFPGIQMGSPPTGALNARGMQFPSNISLYLRNDWREMGLWCGAFYKHWILFPSMWHLPRLPQGRTQGNQNMVKTAIFGIRGWITGKRLKVDGYMLRGILQALNPFTMHAILRKLSPRHIQWKPKCAKSGHYLRPSVCHTLVLQKQGRENIHLFYL